jgi:acyl-coenzyme A thioesterase PaaI-like protein
MIRLIALIARAKNSKFYLWLLNRVLSRSVPFNKPHGLKIIEIYDDGFKIFLPYRKGNLNHINGIHACALATLSEYISGLTLMMNLSSDDYRLVMKSMTMTYHYQAKCDVVVSLRLNKEWMHENILKFFDKDVSVFVDVTSEVYDVQQNLVCTGTTNWQIKKWEAVKTKK